MKVLKIGGKDCPGCIIMKPRWKEIEDGMPELKTEYYEAEDHPDIIKKYDVTALPTFVFVDDEGNELSRLIKIQSKERLVEEIKRYKDKI